jgi:hypothetical protein
MITNEDKLEIVIEKLNTLEFIIQSYIDHAEDFSNKYSLEDVLADCDAKKQALLQRLQELGGVWQG